MQCAAHLSAAHICVTHRIPARVRHVKSRRGQGSRRARTESALMPSTSISLVRPLPPLRMRMALLVTASVFARKRVSSALASPSTGGAVMRMRMASPCWPAISVREARGCTRTRMRTQLSRGSSQALTRVRPARSGSRAGCCEAGWLPWCLRILPDSGRAQPRQTRRQRFRKLTSGGQHARRRGRYRRL